MAFERIELNICPAGDMPVFHCSQYDVGRPIIIDLLNGDDAFTPSVGTTFELHCRKVDDNIVTLDTYEVDGNTLTFTSTEQLCACPGDNLCEVAIYLDELCMGTLNFMLHVEPDPLAGGLESETQIYNLYEQVEEITEQVIGDDYYNKTQVDDLLDTKADKATTYTKTEVDTALNLKADKSTTYTKTETNNLLAGKADASDTYTKAQVESKLSLKADKATTYTKTETDTLLGYKANTSDVYTRSQTDTLLNNKADKSTTYTKTQVDNALALKANSADLATVATTGDYDDLLNKPTIPAAQVQSDYAQSDNTQVDYIKNKPDIEGMISNAILDIMPVDSVSGAVAIFDTEIAAPLVNVSCDIVATGGGGTPAMPVPIVGYSQAVITANSTHVTITFGQTVYGGVLDVTRGTLTVTHYYDEYDENAGWIAGTDTKYFAIFNQPASKSNTDLTQLCNIAEGGGGLYENYGKFRAQTNGAIAIGNKNPDETLHWADLTAFKADVALNHIQVCYKLATPFDIDLTPVQIRALAGENNVFNDTNGDTAVKFKDSIQHYIDTKVGS